MIPSAPTQPSWEEEWELATKAERETLEMIARRQFCAALNKLLEPTWTPADKRLGRWITLDTQDVSLVDAIRNYCRRLGWNCWAFQDGGLYGHPVEFRLWFGYR